MDEAEARRSTGGFIQSHGGHTPLSRTDGQTGLELGASSTGGSAGFNKAPSGPSGDGAILSEH